MAVFWLAGQRPKLKNGFFSKNVFDTKKYSSDGDHTWHTSCLEHLRYPPQTASQNHMLFILERPPKFVVPLNKKRLYVYLI